MTVLQRLAGQRLVRRAADAALHRYARRRAAFLDRLNVAEAQRSALLRLVRRARDTRFGRDHDFARVRSVADYQRRVPLREYEALWQQYWQPAYPVLRDVTWPGLIPYFALSSGTTSGTTKYVPVSREMVASNRRAALTTLALFLAARPDARLFTGRIFFLGGSTDLTPLAPGVLGGDLSGIAAREVSDVLRPYTFPPLGLALLRDWERKLDRLAEESARLPITAVSGVPSWLLVLFERLLQVTGQQRVRDVWPSLRLVIHGGTTFDPYRPLFERLVGEDRVSFVETYPASEGFVATEDPRHGLLRLIPDHGVFFEFVPVEELNKDTPARHTVADVELGVQYAVVLTTCAGLWAYLLGDTVCFERRDPPLLRFTGRTKQFLSAFGEHLIGEEVERAIAAAARATGAEAVEFHVGPVFPERPGTPGRHRYLVEFARPPADLARFAAELDAELCRLNEDYAAHRQGNLTMLPPEVRPVPRGGFAAWMKARGKLGGQHKVPRLDSSGRLTGELSARLT
ncbi:MAG TPA: GH3 auxin-responsive promoter family protein, partial [Gemmataceae bacterium]|nr:GH3 auxin-responsive promoter family protein [Gemmataceae bacterium]